LLFSSGVGALIVHRTVNVTTGINKIISIAGKS